MQHASSGRHAAGRDDDLGHGRAVKRLGFVRGVDILGDGEGGFGFGRAHLVVVGMRREDIAGVDRHRAVEEDGQVGNALAPSSAGADRRAASARGRPRRRGSRPCRRVRPCARWLRPARLPGWRHRACDCHRSIRPAGSRPRCTGSGANMVGSLGRPRSPENTIFVPWQVSSIIAAPRMWPARRKRASTPGHKLCGLWNGTGAKLLQRLPRVVLGIERQRRLVLGEAVAVGELGVLLLQIAAVGQQDLAQIGGGLGRDHLALEAVLDQQRQIAGMIEMGMGQEHGVEARRMRPAARPVAQAQLLVALEQAAIDQKPLAVDLEKIFGAGDGADGAEKGEFDGHLVSAAGLPSPCIAGEAGRGAARWPSPRRPRVKAPSGRLHFDFLGGVWPWDFWAAPTSERPWRIWRRSCWCRHRREGRSCAGRPHRSVRRHSGSCSSLPSRRAFRPSASARHR